MRIQHRETRRRYDISSLSLFGTSSVIESIETGLPFCMSFKVATKRFGYFGANTLPGCI